MTIYASPITTGNYVETRTSLVCDKWIAAECRLLSNIGPAQRIAASESLESADI